MIIKYIYEISRQVCVMGYGTQMIVKACWALVQVNKGHARNCHGHFMYSNLFDLSVVIVYIIRLRLRVIQHKTQSFVCLFKYLVWFPCVTLWKIPGYDKPYQAFYITYVHVFWPMYMCFDDENQACGLCLSKIWRVSFYLWKNCILQVRTLWSQWRERKNTETLVTSRPLILCPDSTCALLLFSEHARSVVNLGECNMVTDSVHYCLLGTVHCKI